MIKRLLLFLLLPLLATANNNPFEFETQLDNAQHRTITYIKLHYADGKKMIKMIHIMKSTLLSPQGTVGFSSQNRTIVLSDDQTHTNLLLHFIHQLDTPSPQVMIHALIINIDKNYAKKLGASFSQDNNNKSAQLIDQAHIPLLGLVQDRILNLKIDLLERHGHADIIAKPLLFTLNNQAATIESGSEIPYQQYNKNGGTNISFKKAVLRLQVTPTVLPKEKILLKIKVNQDSISNLSINGEPAIKTQNLTTKVILNNHQSVILGGIFNQTVSHYINGIPIVKDIPILGHLFQSQHTIKQQKELLLLITPTIQYNT